jgi:hypothetical protein
MKPFHLSTIKSFYDFANFLLLHHNIILFTADTANRLHGWRHLTALLLYDH